MSKLSDAVKNYKLKHPELTDKEIANQLHISPQTYLNCLYGNTTPRESTLSTIALGLGVDVADLREAEEEPEETEVHIHVADRKTDQVGLRETVLLYFFSINDREKRMTTEEICVTADEFLASIASRLK